MKKYLSLFVVLAIVFAIGINVAKAEDSAVLKTDKTRADMEKLTDLTPEKRAEAKMKMETMREEAKKKLKTLKEQIKSEKDANLAKIKMARVAGRENAMQRFDEAVSRITNLKNRVAAEITKLQAKGV